MIRKYFYPLVYGILFLFILFLWYIDYSLPDGKMHISMLNVGQGDSILITTPKGKNILVDGGPFKNILESLPPKISFFSPTIDLLILSHPHADHYEGLFEVLRRYDVKQVLLTGIDAKESTYTILKQVMDDKPIIRANSSQDLEIEKGVFLDILSDAKASKDLNETSLVAMLRYGETRVLLTGDMTQKIENQVLLSGIDVTSSILKVAHHGSKTSTGKQFLSFVHPAVALISVGKGNTFKHPNIETLAKLKEADVQVYRTDESGTVDMSCDTEYHCDVTHEDHPHDFGNARSVESN